MSSSYSSWSKNEDLRLWNKRMTKDKASLATEFDRSVGSIRSRLKHLSNPEHSAYKRLFGDKKKPASSVASSSSSVGTLGTCGGSSILNKRKPSLTSNLQKKNKFATSFSTCSSNITHPSSSSSSPSSSVIVLDDTSDDEDDDNLLNEEQKQASNSIASGDNIFLTGAAGVGKSYLLQHTIKTLRSIHGKNSVAITASTGVAAENINGVTIHSFAGIGLGKGNPDTVLEKAQRNNNCVHRWQETKVLIIDEVSMIDGKIFDLLDHVGRGIRGGKNNKSEEAFGGLQIVLCGDFFQLPPVSLNWGSGFAFESKAWKEADIQTLELKTVVRQQGEENFEFIQALQQLRLGKCPQSVQDLLATCHVSKKALPTDGIFPTRLYCTNRNVDAENNAELERLSGQVKEYIAQDEFKGNYTEVAKKNLLDQIDKKCAPRMKFKIGAQVMLLKNTPEWNLVNGSRGVVVDFANDEENGINYPIVEFANGGRHMIEPIEWFQGNGAWGSMVRLQLPLKLAWAWTVHKSQGMTLDRAIIQLDDAFDWGQVYVAMSRVKSLEGLWLKGRNISQKVVKAHPKVLKLYGQ